MSLVAAFRVLCFCALFSLLNASYSPCCTFPCKNGGVCIEDASTVDGGYFCDCETTGYYGSHCENAFWNTWISDLLRPSMEFMDWLRGHYYPLWYVVNNVKWMRDAVQRLVVRKSIKVGLLPPQWSTLTDYKSIPTNDNASYFALVLPPVPKNCPTVVGTKGRENFPSVDEIVEKLFKRTKFIPEPSRTSLLLPIWGQHFSHQFLKTIPDGDPRLTESAHHADMSHVYGDTLEQQAALRTFKDGRLKSQIIDGEEWPPYTEDAPVKLRVKVVDMPEEKNFALAHPSFGLFPGLLALSTIWLREHNRVVGLLQKDHPNWDDERLYQTGRMISVVTQLRITINQYLAQLGGGYFKFKFDPFLMHGTEFPYGANRIAAEFYILYHWHALLPDVYRIGDTDYPAENLTRHVGPLLKHGLRTFFESVSKQICGKPSHSNFGKEAQAVAKKVLKQMRHFRVQPLNRYRELLSLKPFESFEEMTGETEVARVAREVYGDIDAVEFFPGIMLEQTKPWGLFSTTLSHLGIVCAAQGLFSDILFSPKWWRPSTYGGKIGWKIVNTEVTVQEFICRNIEGDCPELQFEAPENDYVDPHRNHDEL